MTTDPEAAAIIRRSAARVAATGHHAAVTREDMIQEGWLAVLEAEAAGRVPGMGPHRAAYLTLRTMGAMREASRRAKRQLPDDHCALPECLPADSLGPERAAHLLGQVRRFERCGAATPRMRRALRLLLSGHSSGDAAAEMGVSTSAVSHLLRRVDWLMAMLR